MNGEQGAAYFRLCGIANDRSDKRPKEGILPAQPRRSDLRCEALMETDVSAMASAAENAADHR